MGCDLNAHYTQPLIINFYSHIPCGMWQWRKRYYCNHRQNFYSHIPCGMWPLGKNIVTGIINFYSHIPCGMWPKAFDASSVGVYISTHTSRVGCDGSSAALVGAEKKFLLTHPVWDVTKAALELYYDKTISTHTSRVGCDLVIRHAVGVRNISTHTSRVGCDAIIPALICIFLKFLLTHPVWDVTLRMTV